jgi:glucokinase
MPLAGTSSSPLAAVGLDVGGTKVLGAAVASNGDIICSRKESFQPESDAGDLLKTMASVAGALAIEAYETLGLSYQGVPCLGLGIPGTLNKYGDLTFSANLMAMVGIDVVSDLRRFLDARVFTPDTPIYVENDANCALIGEAALGAARSYEDVMLLTLGTGIGGALMLGGKLVRGAHGYAGEFGHMVVMPGGYRCKCGRKGCLEHYVSGTANRRVSLEDMAGWLALGLANLILAFDPGIIVIGGGFGVGVGDRLLQPVREALPGLLKEYSAEQVPRLSVAELGENAGAVGAAVNAIHVRLHAGQ